MRGGCGLLALLLLAAGTACAAEPRPGRWELSLETRVAAAPDFAPPAGSLSECFSAADARDPARMIGAIATPEASACTYRERSYQGNVFRFTLECSGDFALKTRGEVTFSADEFSGELSTSGQVGGQTTEFKSRLKGKRLGGC